jgi:hypothetical protein
VLLRVSICTFVPVKQASCCAMSLRLATQSCVLLRVSICTFVLVKQVNCRDAARVCDELAAGGSRTSHFSICTFVLVFAPACVLLY